MGPGRALSGWGESPLDIQFQALPGPGDPYPQLPGRGARYSLNSGPRQDLLKLVKKRASDDFSHFLRFQRLPAVRLPN